LEILEERGVRATFFVIGEKVKEHPEHLSWITNGGHQVANHSFVNRPTLFLTDEEFRKSLLETEALIQQNSQGKLFRPASGWIRPGQLRIADELGFAVVLASAYVSDPRNPSTWYMSWALKAMLRRGAIVVLHDGSGSPEDVISVLSHLLDHAEKLGLQPVTVGELLERSERSE
jgi:peptidoglycan/xylan/chitin deacetylase (PgdA/CDA1 family)